MAGQSGLTRQVAELVIQATQRFTSHKIDLDTLLDDLGLSAADMDSLYAVLREALSPIRAILTPKKLQHAVRVGDLVKIVTRTLRQNKMTDIPVGGIHPPEPGSRGGTDPRTEIGGNVKSTVEVIREGIVRRKGIVAPDVRPEVRKRPEIIEEVAPKITRNVGIVEIAPEVRPEIRPEVRPEIRPEIGPEIRSEIHPGIGPEIRPEIGPEVRPEIKTVPRAELALDMGPEDKPAIRPETERHINIWIGQEAPRLARELKIGEYHVINFKVGAAVAVNLIGGPDAIVPAADVPAGGLPLGWLVIAQDAELAAGTPDTTVTEAMVGGVKTWSGRFNLVIPETGDSMVPQLMVKPLKDTPHLDVVITARRELYRQFKIVLAASERPGATRVEPIRVIDELLLAPAAQIGLRTTHEWTTPTSVLNVTVVGSQAAVQGNAGGVEVNSIVPWGGVQALASGRIKNVRDAAEQLRATFQKHFDDIDQADLAHRLKSWGKGSGGPEYNWSSLGNHADAGHEQQWDRMAVSAELRLLALQGKQLFQAFFPNHSDLRDWMAALSPGARLNITWTRLSGGEFIPHVPWGLMYLADVPPAGQPVDPMGFLGLRCRVAYHSHAVQAASRALGALNETHRAHFLYWGDGANDVTGQEARWQRNQWSIWQNQVFVPQQAAKDAKADLLQLLNDPQPAPTSLLYFFCQCNADASNTPALRFGATNDIANMVKQTDFGTTALADRPLVFANACTTAAADPYMANELEENFFERECRAYLGTETKVPIVFGSRFAAIFFHFFYRILDPEPMAAGEAVAQTRLFLWTHYRNIGGLFYCYVNQYELFLARDDEVRKLRA